MRIGVDLGGTKIEAATISDTGEIRLRQRAPTPRGNYEATLRAVVDLVELCRRTAGEPCTVGIGIPGAISPATGLVKNANSTWLIGKPLHVDLERALGRSVRLANDANCFTLSEACDGAAAGAAVVFGVIVGTGTGGGLAVRQQIITGPNAIAGEWGHNPLPWPDPEELPGEACYCGRSGCIETFLSGPGLARDHERNTGARLGSEQIAALAEAGDGQAEATLRRYERRMARALASIINVLDPDVIVLGGGLSKLSRLYANVPAQWAAWVFSDRVDTRLVAPRHGDASGVRGAAWLWPAPEAI